MSGGGRFDLESTVERLVGEIALKVEHMKGELLKTIDRITERQTADWTSSIRRMAELDKRLARLEEAHDELRERAEDLDARVTSALAAGTPPGGRKHIPSTRATATDKLCPCEVFVPPLPDWIAVAAKEGTVMLWLCNCTGHGPATDCECVCHEQQADACQYTYNGRNGGRSGQRCNRPEADHCKGPADNCCEYHDDACKLFLRAENDDSPGPLPPKKRSMVHHPFHRSSQKGASR